MSSWVPMLSIQGHVDVTVWSLLYYWLLQFCLVLLEAICSLLQKKNICFTPTVKVYIAWLFDFHHHTHLFWDTSTADSFHLKSFSMSVLLSWRTFQNVQLDLSCYRSREIVLHWGHFTPQETLSIAWRNCQLSQFGDRDGGTGTWWVKARDAAKPAAMHRTPSTKKTYQV